jgi:hypothetical protein
MKKIQSLTAAVLALALLVTGCKKDQSESLSPQQEETAAAAFSESEMESEMAYDDVFDNVVGVNAEVGFGGTGVFGRLAADGTTSGREMGLDSVRCYTVTVTRLDLPRPFPVRIVVDFGTGCAGRDGRVRQGKIITTYTGPLVEPGRSATTRFENYKIDSLSIEGTHTLANTTTLGSNQRQFTITVVDGKITRPNGNYQFWNSTRVRTQVEGNGTLAPVDDVFTVTGSARGRVKRGANLFAWRSEITEPLRKRFTCRWISKGIVRAWRETLSPTSPFVASLNFGAGTCDNQAVLTINGNSRQITLR